MGVIIANTGSPAAPTPEAVFAYLSEFLMDDRIVSLPRWLWKILLHKAILPKRQYASAKKYQEIWTEEGSPLVVHETRLAAKLESALSATGRAARVRIGMSYGAHSIADACRQLKEEGCSQVAVLPAYPQSAYCITGSVRDTFQRAFSELHWHVPALFIDRYGNEDAYRQAVADSILEAGYDRSSDRIMFDFHSIPLKDQRAGDTYADQIREDMTDIAARLGAPTGSWTICYSSAFGPHPSHWTGPLAHNVLHEWGRDMAAGQVSGRIFFVTPGFSADCLETLWDIPHLLKPTFIAEGGAADRFVTVPPLNESNRAVAVFMHVLERYLPNE